MRVLLAFDKFKDALTARAACDIAAAALREHHANWQLDLCPLADGGEGFGEILTAAAGGECREFSVTGPRGDPVRAPVGFVPLARIPATARTLLRLESRGTENENASLAVVEMAAASGLALLAPERRDPWQATSLGTGELLRHAAAQNVAAILLGIGGSATNDLGLGALAALGAEFSDAASAPLRPPMPATWPRIATMRPPRARTLPPIRIACDVTNPLLGPRGAAAIYGPQKGLRAADLKRMEHEMARLALMLCHACDRPDALMDVPGTGAAGGISFGLMAAADAQLLPGFDLVAAWLDLDARLAAADLVITGEGRFDDSSLSGKGPGAVVARALALGKRVHVFAGAVSLAAPPPRLAVSAITPPGVPLERALPLAAENLAVAVRAALP
ncbi:MAG TPA: glycerate kinase [Opitutaceae bacterium]|nr:glycerate kinase [Opitutaceae bacterium]